MDIFERIAKNPGPLGQYAEEAHGYYTFPKLVGEIAPHMEFQGKMMLNWSLNNYIGLANHPEVRQTDADATARWGMAYPMGARMMSGNSEEPRGITTARELFAFFKNNAHYGLKAILSGIVRGSCTETICVQTFVVARVERVEG